MEVKVRIYGTLRKKITTYDSAAGLAVDMPAGSTIKDLLERLDLLEGSQVSVIAGGRVLELEDKLQNDLVFEIFQTIKGG